MIIHDVPPDQPIDTTWYDDDNNPVAGPGAPSVVEAVRLVVYVAPELKSKLRILAA